MEIWSDAFLALFLTGLLGGTCEDSIDLTITITMSGSLADVTHRLDWYNQFLGHWKEIISELISQQ